MLKIRLSVPKCVPYRSIIPMRRLSHKTTTIQNVRLNSCFHSPMQISKFHINEIIQARKAKAKTTSSTEKPAAEEEDGIPILKQQILQLMMKKKLKKEQAQEEVSPDASAKQQDHETTSETVQEAKPKRSIKAKPRVVLIDASSLIYKSHYAHSTLQNGALFGYVRYLLRLVNELKPFKNIVVVFDGPRAENFRSQIYADYKNNRKETPSDLRSQRDLFPEATEACNIPHICLSGVEGDDVIASLAKQAVDSGSRVTIVSPDKDFFQLVSDDVEIYDVDKKLFKGIKEIQEKIGVHPEMAAQLQALTGDDVDNIPGVPGIGDKTAAALLNKWKSLESIFENLDEICTSAKLKKLKDSVDVVKRNLDLTKLKDDLDVPGIAEFQAQAIEKDKLVAFLEKNHMKSILQKLETESMEDYDPTIPSKEIQVPVDEITETVEETQDKEPVDPASLIPEGVTVVRDRETAERIQKQLRTMTDRYHACDTEAIDVDINRSPVGQGKIICFSIFCGPDADFGQGPRIWVDTMEDEGILQIFKDYFEDPNIKKVWHNYSFDTHVLATSGIISRGFGGDTMQMARLWDSSRVFKGGYSLQGLTENLALPIEAKKTIKERFGKSILKKDGTPSKKVDSPELDEIQRDAQYIHEWIEYSTLDSESTWYVREELERLLRNKPWKDDLTMWNFYCQEWLPFGELLVEIEREGIKVNVAHLKEVEEIAKVEYLEHKKTFLEWATKYCPDAVFMNINSDAQKQQLLFGNQPKKEKSFFEEKKLPDERKFETENTDMEILPGETKAKKKKSFFIKGLGLPPVEITSSGLPAVSSKVVRTLAGSNPREGKFGTAYKFFGGDEEGKAACIALDSLHESGAIQTLLSTFIIPLQELVDENCRIHTSLNVNTETGRLSSRRPNLQNQPALEKDRYKIRDAFTCDPGNMLIVADYGQLELRLLAHTTKCKSMIDAFKEGGDFHSRTAIGMYPEIKEAVEKGEVLLEWDFSKGPPPVPLLKDKFASQRKHAKTLNFSIAYGKTAVGLAKDWGVDVNEATKIVDLWYKDRPEVRQWQNETIEQARLTEETRTLLGRYRRLPYNSSGHRGMKGHYDRAAINTPLQGGAADVVCSAMIKLRNCKRLRDLGWRQVLQIHDEIIMEGPEESTEEALQLITQIMRNPLDEPLLVDLDISVQAAKTWYGAK